jgi:hypothetical protein
VKGYEEDRKLVPAFTTFGGLYERAAAMQLRPPFDLPSRWEKRKSHLNLATTFNFVSTADIIGVNSGSPVVNRPGEFVGTCPSCWWFVSWSQCGSLQVKILVLGRMLIYQPLGPSMRTISRTTRAKLSTGFRVKFYFRYAEAFYPFLGPTHSLLGRGKLVTPHQSPTKRIPLAA